MDVVFLFRLLIEHLLVPLYTPEGKTGDCGNKLQVGRLSNLLHQGFQDVGSACHLTDIGS